MKNLRVIELYIQNFMGVKAVTIKPNGDLVKITGKNGAGKSSVIKAIWAAIGGKTAMPVNAIRNGSPDARITVNLGDIIVSRKITPKGEYLEVSDGEGRTYKSPQALLDSLFSKVSIDPQAFIDMRPKERRDILLDLTGQKDRLEEIERDRQSIYDERRMVNREVATLTAKLKDAPDDACVKEVSVTELMQELRAEQERMEGLDALEDALSTANNDLCGCAERNTELTRQIEELERQLKQCRLEFAENEAAIKEIPEKILGIEEKIAAFPPSREPEILARIESAEGHNARCRAIMQARALRTELAAKQSESMTLTEQLKGFEAEKADILNNSKLPLKNIEFSGEVLMIGDVPFDDINEAEQIKIACAIGMSQDPKIRIIRIDRGNELDDESMAEVEKFAAEHDCQIWVQRVSTEPQGGFHIEDGELVEEPEAVEEVV